VILYEAKATNRPEIVEAAFKLSPNNIKVQEAAVRLDLTKKRKLVCSVGAEVKGNKYLIGVEKGTIMPISISRTLITSEDNQTTCSSTLYYGDNKVASLNKKMPRQSSNRHKGGVILHGLPVNPKGEAKMKMIFTIDIYGQLRVKFYSLDNGKSDHYSVDVKGLLTEVKDLNEEKQTSTET
jgi:molecular chaperone DnaK (HSP70)